MTKSGFILKGPHWAAWPVMTRTLTLGLHWLRHTGISDDVKIRPREHVRDDAGHSSGSITDKYIDVESRARHASGKKKNIKPECMLDD